MLNNLPKNDGMSQSKFNIKRLTPALFIEYLTKEMG